MRCFIHSNVEAVSACKECGKGMCANCSAYSGHTGVCPACRLKGFEREYNMLEREKKSAVFWLVISIIAAVALLFAVAVFAIVPGVFMIVNLVKIGKRNERMGTLQVEINKLKKALSQGAAVI